MTKQTTSNSDSAEGSKEIPWWPMQAVLGVAALVLLSTASEIFPRINHWTGDNICWFPVPMLAVGFIAVASAQHLNPCASTGVPTPRRLIFLVLLAIVGLVIASLTLTGWDKFVAGQVTVDTIDAPPAFHIMYAITSGFVAGLTEEASIRGVIQFPLTQRLGSIRAQVLAGGVFVLLHFFTRSDFNEFAFVSLSAIVFGLLAATSRSVWVPAAAHSITNASLTIAVLMMAPR